MALLLSRKLLSKILENPWSIVIFFVTKIGKYLDDLTLTLTLGHNGYSFVLHVFWNLVIKYNIHIHVCLMIYFYRQLKWHLILTDASFILLPEVVLFVNNV